MSSKETRGIPLSEWKRTMPRPLSDDQVSQYINDLEQDTDAHQSILHGCDHLRLDNHSSDESERVAIENANQIFRYIRENKLPRDAFRQLAEAQGSWGRARVNARRVNEADDE